jgi:hypothetical protein
MTTEIEDPTPTTDTADAADTADAIPSDPVPSLAETADQIAAPYFRNAGTRRIIAVVVVFAWLFVFAFGLLIPSEEYRKKLGWNPTTKETQAATEMQNRVKTLEKEIADLKSEKEKSADAGSADAAEKPADAVVGNTPEAPPTKESGDEALPALVTKLETLNVHLDALIKNPPKPAQDDNKVWAFIVATIAFMPMNIAVLCILAGCIGACCVSEETVKDVLLQIKSDDHAAQQGELKRKLNFLTEHPLYSALRGLVVYLLLSSGLFIFAGTQPLVGDIEQTVSLASYIRLAGIFSFLSYIAGHDPTVFTNMIRMGNRQSVDKSKQNSGN